MRIRALLATLLVTALSAPAAAQQAWIGPNLGLYAPTNGDLDLSVGLGGNFIYGLSPTLEFEGSLYYIFLNDGSNRQGFSGSAVPIIGGIRYELSPGLHGDAGLGIYRTSATYDIFVGLPTPLQISSSDTDLGLYFGGGYVLELERVDVDFLLRFHWPSLDDFLIGFQSSVYFPLGGGITQ